MPGAFFFSSFSLFILERFSQGTGIVRASPSLADWVTFPHRLCSYPTELCSITNNFPSSVFIFSRTSPYRKIPFLWQIHITDFWISRCDFFLDSLSCSLFSALLILRSGSPRPEPRISRARPRQFFVDFHALIGRSCPHSTPFPHGKYQYIRS